MHFVKQFSGYSLVQASVNLPKSRIVGKDVEYKYQVVTPAGAYYEELSIPKDFTVGHVNRVLRGNCILY